MTHIVLQLGSLDSAAGYPLEAPGLNVVFEAVEQLKQNEDIKPYSPEEQDVSVKFYPILTSYLRGRCVGLVRRLGKTIKMDSDFGVFLWQSITLLVVKVVWQLHTHWLAIQAFLRTNQQWKIFSTTSRWWPNLKNFLDKPIQMNWNRQLSSGAQKIAHMNIYNSLLVILQATDSWRRLFRTKHPSNGPRKQFSSRWTPLPRPTTTMDLHLWKLIELQMRKEKYTGKSNKGKSKGKSCLSFGSYGFSGRGRGRGKGRGNKGKGKGKEKGTAKGKSNDSGKKDGKKGKGINVVYDLSMVIGAGSVTTGWQTRSSTMQLLHRNLKLKDSSNNKLKVEHNSVPMHRAVILHRTLRQQQSEGSMAFLQVWFRDHQCAWFLRTMWRTRKMWSFWTVIILGVLEIPCAPQKPKWAAARTIQLAQKLEKNEKPIKNRTLPEKKFFGGKWREYGRKREKHERLEKPL